jgi:hypothetical protein
MPSLLLVPAVALFGRGFSQPILSILLGAINVGLAHRLFLRLFPQAGPLRGLLGPRPGCRMALGRNRLPAGLRALTNDRRERALPHPGWRPADRLVQARLRSRHLPLRQDCLARKPAENWKLQRAQER